jgi:hypothetical protein
MPWMNKYGERKITWIMMATVRVTSKRDVWNFRPTDFCWTECTMQGVNVKCTRNAGQDTLRDTQDGIIRTKVKSTMGTLTNRIWWCRLDSPEAGFSLWPQLRKFWFHYSNHHLIKETVQFINQSINNICEDMHYTDERYGCDTTLTASKCTAHYTIKSAQLLPQQYKK